MRRLTFMLRFLCGWFVLYLTVGGLLSFAFDGPYRPELGCVPQSSTAAVLVTNCASAAATLFWSAIVGWPRFVLVAPAWQTALVRAFVKNGPPYWWFLVDAVPFFVISIPLAFAVWGSVSYWKTRSKAFAIAQTAALLGEIIYLGLKM